MNKALHIHFICRGNVYRSRIAEAQLKAKRLPKVIVSSSGIEADRNDMEAVATLPVSIIEAIGIPSWDNFTWRQTEQQAIDSADMVIFLSADVAQEATDHYNFIPEKTETWDIQNLDDVLVAQQTSQHNSTATQAAIQAAILAIQTQIEKLAHAIAISGIVDVVDEQDQLLGYRLPLEWVNRRGLWYRSCHGIVVTSTGKFVLEKRSTDIVFSPGLLDITFGGGVESGEDPRQAILREGREELGIGFDNAQILPLGVYKFHAFHPHYKLYTKSFIYGYLIKLAEADPTFKMQTSEVAAVFMVSRKEAMQLIKDFVLEPYGSLNTDHVYYKQLFEKIQDVL